MTWYDGVIASPSGAARTAWQCGRAVLNLNRRRLRSVDA